MVTEERVQEQEQDQEWTWDERIGRDLAYLDMPIRNCPTRKAKKAYNRLTAELLSFQASVSQYSGYDYATEQMLYNWQDRLVKEFKGARERVARVQGRLL